MKSLLLSWGLNGTTGWGVNGANLARNLWPEWQVYSDGGIDWSTLPPWWKLEGWDVLPATLECYDVAIYAAGNGVAPVIKPGLADRFFIETFIEDTHITPIMVQAYNDADGVIVGSKWNRDLLAKAGVGVERLHLIHQGADNYATVEGIHAGDCNPPFVRHFFSGGKLEQRKGQDVVVAAFREYLRHDPDAVLVTAWQNQWVQTMKGVAEKGYVKGIPGFWPNGQLDIVGWCERNGIPRKNVIDLGLVPFYAIQHVVARCTYAIQVSRAEGGVPLPALEALAVNTPVLTCDGTGTADLKTMGAQNVETTPFTGKHPLYREVEGWVEPDVDSLVGLMKMPRPDGWDFMPEVPSWWDHASAVRKVIE